MQILAFSIQEHSLHFRKNHEIYFRSLMKLWTLFHSQQKASSKQLHFKILLVGWIRKLFVISLYKLLSKTKGKYKCSCIQIKFFDNPFHRLVIHLRVIMASAETFRFLFYATSFSLYSSGFFLWTHTHIYRYNHIHIITRDNNNIKTKTQNRCVETS